MRRIRCILVAVKEPTTKSQPALAKAAQLARALDAALVLFQAIAAPLYLESSGAGLSGIRNIDAARKRPAVRGSSDTHSGWEGSGCGSTCWPSGTIPRTRPWY